MPARHAERSRQRVTDQAERVEGCYNSMRNASQSYGESPAIRNDTVLRYLPPDAGERAPSLPQPNRLVRLT